MAEVAERQARAVKPAAVILSLVHSPFAADVPMAVIRRKWPRLYPYARSVAERLKAFAGGAEVPTPAGWPYRFTRWSVGRLVGREPEVPVEDAIRYTTEAIDSLLRLEDFALTCGFFMRIHGVTGKDLDAQRRRIAAFKAEVSRYCEQRHVDVFDRDEAFARANETHQASGRDAAYGALRTRELTAALLSERILRILQQGE